MIIGIDLGTTNSLAAYFTANGAQIIPNRLGKLLTPSAVSVDEEGTVYVGESALERRMLYPDTVAAAFKRSMGSDREYRLGKQSFLAEELSSFVLRALKEDAEAFLKEPVTEAVISVPAYFDDRRRKATKRAGELAGLKVERIISEPTAAAVAYGLYEKQKNTRFLVFDLGGGTFDVSILELYGTILEVRAVAGDNYLGGEDFTETLERLFLQKCGLTGRRLTGREQARMFREAERGKRLFNDAAAVRMKVRLKDGEGEWTAEITRQEYAQACEPLLDKIRQPVKRSLSDARLKLSDIDVIVLVGGATRMQIVREFIIRLFRKFPDTRIDPDKAVALGAAVQAAMKERKSEVKEVILTDVCPFTLGTDVMRSFGNGAQEAGYFCPIIERNTVIPASRTERFYTAHDGQDRIRIRVLQGESRFAENNLCLGELELEVPKGPAGKESVDVTYTYDINSILEVEVCVVSTGERKRAIIKGGESELTEEQIEARMQELSYLKIQPGDMEENKLVLLRAERAYEELLGQKRREMERQIRCFEDALKEGDRDRIREEREALTEQLDELW